MSKILKHRESPQSYAERMRVGRVFYAHLYQVFLVTAFICLIGLGYLWFWLARYEANSTNGAMTAYMKEVQNGKWDTVYAEDTDNFVELNSKDKYISYLENLYSDKDLSGVTFTLSSADDDSQYYDVYYRQEKISTLQLKKASGSGAWKVRTVSNDRSFSFDVLASDIGFQINGVEITSDYENTSGQVPAGFADLHLDSSLPSVTRYSISSFIDVPDVEPDDANQNMVVKDASGDQFYIGAKPTDAQYSDFAEQIQATAFAYCRYITEDGTFYQLNQHLYPNTTFYNNIAGFNNQWFSTHDSIDFQNVNIFDVIPVGDKAFIGSISFDYVVTTASVSKTYSGSYQLFFVKNSKKQWKLTNLVLINS